MSDPRFLEGWLRSRPAPQGPSSLQVRADAPDGLTYAPDQTDPHTASRRLFVVPPLPEPPELLYDFEDEIIGFERATRKEPTFVLGDDEQDGLTPAQKIATEYRGKDTKSHEELSENRQDPPAEDGTEGKTEPVGTSKEPESSSKEDRASKPEGQGTNEKNSDVPKHESPSDSKMATTEKVDGKTQPGEQKNSGSEQEQPSSETTGRDDPTKDEVRDQVSKPDSSKEENELDKNEEVRAQKASKDQENATKESAKKQPESKAPQVDDDEKTEEKNTGKHKDKDAKGDKLEKQDIDNAKRMETPKDDQKDQQSTPVEKKESSEPDSAKDLSAQRAEDEKDGKKYGKASKEKPQKENKETKSANATIDSENKNGQGVKTTESEKPKATSSQAAADHEDAGAPGEKESENKLKASSQPEAAKEQATTADQGKENEKSQSDRSEKLDEAKPESNFDKTPEKDTDTVSVAQNKSRESQEVKAAPRPRSTHTTNTFSLPWPKPPAHRIPVADTASIRSAQSHAASLAPSTAPTISQMTLKSNMDRSRPEAMPKVVQEHFREYPYKLPPSHADAKYKTHVWDAPKYSTLRSAEMLSQQPEGRDAGSQWERVSGYGQMQPFSAEAQRNVTLDTVHALFVPDPRAWHPYRFVRRTDPRQVLLMATGTALTGKQVQAAEAAKRAATQGATKSSIDSLRSLASYFGTTENTEVQGGIGVVYSPCAALCEAMGETFDSARAETNLSRRLERPDYLNRTTTQRAALRSVIAALEYVNWEREGFDKVVIAVHNAWIVRGISHDIWTWRKNGWVLTRETPQGMPGESVPNRDLWELLDYLVRQFEDIECVTHADAVVMFGSGISPRWSMLRPCASRSRARYVWCAYAAQRQSAADARPVDKTPNIAYFPNLHTRHGDGHQASGRCRRRDGRRERGPVCAALPGAEQGLVPSGLAPVHWCRGHGRRARDAGPRAARAKHDPHRGGRVTRARATQDAVRQRRAALGT